MPKIRSHSGAKKRFIVTKKGKVKFKPGGMRHLLTGMPANKGRKLRKQRYLTRTEGRIVKACIPYA
jgi:large subunit ribosomal protein L35